MLGTKSTCKDRWRQALAEAAKIPHKHLLTLEPGISEPQTTQMAKSKPQLVVPQAIQESYTAVQRDWLWNLEEFIRDVRGPRAQVAGVSAPSYRLWARSSAAQPPYLQCVI